MVDLVLGLLTGTATLLTLWVLCSPPACLTSPKQLPVRVDPAELLGLSKAEVAAALAELERELAPAPTTALPVPAVSPCPWCRKLLPIPHGCCLTPSAPKASPIGRVVRLLIDGEDMLCRIMSVNVLEGLVEVRLVKHDSGSGPSVWLPKEVVEDRDLRFPLTSISTVLSLRS